ncbi:MAG TPA: S41 family peptidase [bacterium]|nr:S41 family peptidase [bacterium]
MDRRPSLLTTAFLLLALCAVSFGAGAATQSAAHPKETSEDVYKYLQPFTAALAIIREKYVDVDKTNPKDLVYGALQGMVNTLDPFSQFMPPDDYKEMQTETSGKFGGLGIEIAIKDDRLTIISPIEGTPADRAGLKAGDRITKIGDEKTDTMTINDAVKRLRGKIGTKVTITIAREGLGEPFDVTLIRDSIKIESIHSYMLPHQIGYVRITEFIENTTDDFIKAVDDLKKKGPLKGLVVDLRNDPGGLLNEAVGVSDYFTEKGKMLVSTKGRSANQTQEFKATDGEKFDKNKPVVCMVNEGSASGAEIVAGALKDWKRAVLIGSKTFGKGSVQTILPLDNSDGAALRLTMAKYYTPSGVCIHGIGIDPDLDLRNHEISESTIKVYSKQIPNKFAKELVKGGMEVTRDTEVTPELMARFYAYCAKNVKKIDTEELKKDEDYLRNSLYVELIREKLGEKDARELSVLKDKQVQVAEQIIEDGGKISKQLFAEYPKKKGKEEKAGEKKLEEERAKKNGKDLEQDKDQSEDKDNP